LALINQRLVEQGFAVSGIRVTNPSLEEIFVSNVGLDAGSSAADLQLATA
jgi:hypothetical protein